MSDARLTLVNKVLSYGDVSTTSNPDKVYCDVSYTINADVNNPKNEKFTLYPNETRLIFDGTVSTSINNSTEFTLSLSTLDNSRYRFTYTGTGAAPAFRTDRVLTLSGVTLTLTANSNSTLTFAGSAGNFTSVAIGDVIFIPDTTTGDSASPFSGSNVGYWEVLSKNGTSSILQLSRPSGTGFTGASEVVVPSTNSQVQAFSSSGLQVGNKVTISLGFSSSIWRTYEIVAVNPSWFEVISVAVLPVSETAVPTTSGIKFYNNSKRYVKATADQECVIRTNDSTSDNEKLSPWIFGDSNNVAEYSRTGPTWNLTVINKSDEALNFLLISVE